MENPQKIDFLSVGDVFNDTFIELEDAHVTCDIDHENCTISMKFGDKLPYKSAEVVRGVGNAGNAATSASRLGLSSALLTFTGDDDDGKKIFDYFEHEKVSHVFMKKDANFPTNNAYVLKYGPERTILVKQEAYPYTVPTELLANNKPKWIYLTSIGKTTLPFHHDLMNWLKENSDVKLAFQPGTFQMQFGVDALKDVYAQSEVFVCNVEESQRILKLETRDLHVLLKAMHDLGPKIVCITDGPAGAYMSDGTDAYFMPIYPDPKPPISRTGCGDAFASTFVSMLSNGKTPLEAFRVAPVNSMHVIQFVGAQKGLLTEKELEEWLAKAPTDYQPKKI